MLEGVISEIVEVF